MPSIVDNIARILMTDTDLIFFQLDQSIDWSIYMTKWTACLIVLDNDISDQLLTSIVVGAADVGCTWFLTWGAMADSLEDRIDEILENGTDDWLRIATISLTKKTAEEVANFLFVAALPNRVDARCLVIGDRTVDELMKVVANQI